MSSKKKSTKSKNLIDETVAGETSSVASASTNEDSSSVASSAEKASTSAKESPVSVKETSATAKEPPASAKETETSAKETPGSAKDTASSVKETPVPVVVAAKEGVANNVNSGTTTSVAGTMSSIKESKPQFANENCVSSADAAGTSAMSSADAAGTSAGESFTLKSVGPPDDEVMDDGKGAIEMVDVDSDNSSTFGDEDDLVGAKCDPESNFREVKEAIEVFSIGLKVGAPCEKFSVRLPEGVKSGTILSNIDGAGHSVVIPEGYGAGDTIILLLPKSQKTGDLPLPNRNCPAALRVIIDSSEEYFLEGTVVEADVAEEIDLDGIDLGSSIIFNFISDAEEGKVHRNVPLNLLLDITHEGEKSVRSGDKIIAYKKANTLVLCNGVVVGDQDGEIVVNFSDGDRLRVKREWVFHQKRYRPNSETDLSDSRATNDDILAELEFQPDSGMNAPAYNSFSTSILARLRCFIHNEAKNQVGEKHISSRKAIHNRDRRSVRKLKPDGTFEFYPYFATHIPFYWFPGISWLCSKANSEPTSILDKYGFGVVSYFKIVKSLIVLFFVMSLLTTPSAVLYFASNSSWGREAYFLSNVNTLASLTLTTIAAVGEPKLVCRDGLEGETVSLTCPTNHKLRSVVAYYGQPTGTCSCPTLQQVSQEIGKSGTCKSSPTYDQVTRVFTGCSESVDPYSGEYVQYGCQSGTDRFGNQCCAFGLKSILVAEESLTSEAQYRTVANLDSLDLRATIGCDSATAQLIATALCEGKDSCSFIVDSSVPYVVPLDAIPAVPGMPGCSITSVVNGVKSCTMTLADGNPAQFGSCKTVHLTDQSYNMQNLYPFYDVQTSTKTFLDRRLIVEGICEIDTVVINDQNYIPAEVVKLTSYLNAASILVFVIGITWIKIQLKKESLALSENTVTASDYTIACYTLPPEARDSSIVTSVTDIKEKLKVFFEKSLFDETDGAPIDVADVNLVTSCDTYLTHCVERGAAANDVDRVLARIQSRMRRNVWDPTDSHSSILLNHLKEKLIEFEYANDVCKATSFQAEQSSHMAYITFADEDAYLKALKKYPYAGSLTRLTQHADDMYEGQTVVIQPAPNPEDIKFENVPVSSFSRLLRVTATTLATLLMLTISYAMIYQARYVANIYSVGVTQVDCSSYQVDVTPFVHDGVNKVPNNIWTSSSAGYITYSDVLMDEYPAFYSLNATNSVWGQRGIKRCYCSEVLYSAFKNGDANPKSVMTSYPFENPYTQEPETLCQDPTNALSMALKVLSTLVVVGVNCTLVLLLSSMVSFERHASKTGELLSSAFKLFIAQYINTAILIIIISGDVEKAGLSHLEWKFTLDDYPEFQLGIFSGTISDYDSTWYLSVGSTLMFTMLLFSFSLVPIQYVAVAQQKLRRLWDRRWSFKHGFSLANTQEELDEMYLGPPMPIQDKYGYLLTLIFCDMTFSPTMPLFNLITLFNLFIFYVSDKYCLLFFFTKPPAISASLPKAVVNSLYLAAVLHMANGIWMFGNQAFSLPDIQNHYEVHYTPGAALRNSHDLAGEGKTIIWQDRAFNDISFPLTALAIVFGGLILLAFVRAFLVDVLGLKTCWRALGNYLDRNSPAWNFIGVKEVKNLGLPPYFESMNAFTLKQRVTEHTLDPIIEGKYLAYIQQEEEDKKKLGLSFTVEKARMMRILRASEKYEHRRRSSLMRLSMTDSSRISLDNMDAAHDVAGFIEDMKKKDKQFHKDKKTGTLGTLALAAAGAAKGGAASFLKAGIGIAPDIEAFHSTAGDATSAHAQRHHGAALQKSLPNRNCPVAYSQPGMKSIRFYEGTYLQYTDPKSQFGALSNNLHKTHFTFMKHEIDEDKQNEADEIADVDPRNVSVMTRARAIPFDYGSDVDEDFETDDVVGVDDCCGHPIAVKYNNMHFSRRNVDKSFINEEDDIPLFEVGDSVVLYKSADADYLVPGTVCGVEEQVNAENDPVKNESEVLHAKNLKARLLAMSNSTLQKHPKYEARYMRSINSRTDASVVKVTLSNNTTIDVPVQWVRLHKPLKYNRAGTFNNHSGVDFIKKISSGLNHIGATLEVGDEHATNIDSDNYYYKGKLVMGRPAGQGKFVYANNDMYVGEFINGYFHGYGTYMYTNRDDKVDTTTGLYADGTKPLRDYYEGDFYKGKRHGHGVFACNSGDKTGLDVDKKLLSVSPEWSARDNLNDPPNGSINSAGGESRCRLGGRPYLYQGEWRHGKIHGYGKKIYTDGSGVIQVGDWIAGEPANGYYRLNADHSGWEKSEKPTLAELNLPKPLISGAAMTLQERSNEIHRIKFTQALLKSKKLSNRLFKRGELAENTIDCGKCIPTFDDNTHDLLKDRCGNTVYICTCCCACACSPGHMGSISSTNKISKVRRHKKRSGPCGICGSDNKVDDALKSASSVGDKIRMKASCCDKYKSENKYAGTNESKKSAESNDVYDDDSDDEEDNDENANWSGFDKATGLHVDSLQDGSFFSALGSLTDADSEAQTKSLQTPEGELTYRDSTVVMGGAGGPDEARQIFNSATSGIKKKSKKHSHTHNRNMLNMDSAESGQHGNSDETDEADAMMMEGHESYNLNTIREYQKKFGLGTVHMARLTDPIKDMIMQVTNLTEPNDPPNILKILHDNSPYKLKYVSQVKKLVRKLKDGAEKDPLTGNYHSRDYEMVEELVDEVKFVVPSHSLWMSRHMPRMCGGVSACNDRVGCECLAEPSDEGVMPKHHAACC